MRVRVAVENSFELTLNMEFIVVRSIWRGDGVIVNPLGSLSKV